MYRGNHIDYMGKIQLLERYLGSQNYYSILEPVGLLQNPYDIYELNMAARYIASFIGLHYAVFYIRSKELQNNVAGEILLDGSDEVTIYIAPKTLQYRDAVLAILAHEITHKFLFDLNLILEDEKENEILTDIATVYLGLGKLMLNGCYFEETTYSSVPFSKSIRVITTSMRVGYLTQSQFILVYLLLCKMKGIEQFQYESNLNSSCLKLLNVCRNYVGR